MYLDEVSLTVEINAEGQIGIVGNGGKLGNSGGIMFNIANAFGLSDMHGNVWEWCQDEWHVNYQGAPRDGSARQEDSLHNNRCVIRGGSWFFNPGRCRSAYRYDFTSGKRKNAIGADV